MLLIPVLLLAGLGLVFVYSASSHMALHRLGDGYFYLKRQTLFCIPGFAVLFAARHIPCRLYGKLVYPLLLASLALLVLLLIPGFGHRVGAACRWFRVAGFSFQPAELAKFSLAVYMAYSMAKKGSHMETFSKGLVPHLVVAGLFMGLIVFQPDLGTAVILGCWILIVLFVGGVKPLQVALVGALSMPLLLWLIWQAPYRMKRWGAFMNPWEDPNGMGFQIIHSYLAFGSGGLFGAGLGNSKQKLFYLPESHTDFILSIAGEELGFAGVACVVILFGMVITRGLQISLRAKDLYSSYLAFGLTCLLALQVLINMGVVLGLLPTKGLTLPLISYGGSSLLITLWSMGVLLNIAAER